MLFLCVIDASVFYGRALALQRLSAAFCIEWTSLSRWSSVTTWFQTAMSDSISSRLLVGCLFDISKATLCQRFSIGFRSGDWAGQSSVLKFFWDIHLVTSLER